MIVIFNDYDESQHMNTVIYVIYARYGHVILHVSRYVVCSRKVKIFHTTLHECISETCSI